MKKGHFERGENVSDQKPLFVSYYTKGSVYETEAKELVASLDRFGLDHEVVAIEDKGSWSANCCFKAEFLLKMLEKHQRPVVWVDADSIITQTPDFFNGLHADVALYVNDHVEPSDSAKILTGTMFANNTASAKKLLQLWQKEGERMLETYKGLVLDQVALRRVVLHYPTIVEMKRLPERYISIVPSKEMRTQTKDGVIVHYQASREVLKMEDDQPSHAFTRNVPAESLLPAHA